MTEQPHRPVPAAAKGSARRRRIEGGRPHTIKIRFTEAEFAAIITCADAAHVSVQHYLTDAAFCRRPTANASLIAELQGLRRLVLNMANNVNQIARRLNSGGRPDASVAAASNAACRTLEKLDTALGWLGAPPAPRKPTATADESVDPGRPDRFAAPFRPAAPQSAPAPTPFRPRPKRQEDDGP